MTWTVTLIVNDCNTSDPLEDVFAPPLVTPFGQIARTDANGRLIATFPDALPSQIVTLRKTETTPTAAFGYIELNYSFNRENNGETDTVCLNPAPPDEAMGEGDGCFIVTAATGSRTSAEVDALRAARDRVAQRSELAGQLIERIYEEYRTFSPPLANRMRGDSEIRTKVLDLVVRPLVTWYQLAVVLAFDHENRPAVERAVAAHRDACSCAGPVENLATALANLSEVGSKSRPAYLPLAVAVARFDFVRWAIVDPLVAIAGEPQDIKKAIALWLSEAPIERLPPPADAADLRSLATFFDFDPDARRQLGARLLAKWPGLRSEIADADFEISTETI